MSTVTTSSGVGGSSVAVTPNKSQLQHSSKREDANAPSNHHAFVRQLIGDGARVTEEYRSVDYWKGNSMSSTGLAYNISGRATVIEAGVGERLAGFEDPIKAVFGTAIVGDKTVLVKRKYVVGGQAIITPERAPARTVQVKEDVTTVELQRYGGDIEMNTNLFNLPGEAQAELDMKLDAQKRELERKLVSLGYAEIFSKGVRLPDAVVRSNPTFVGKLSSLEAQEHARMMYFRGCFGAFAKNEFPLANILAAAKTASAYTSATSPGSVLVIPHGSPELLQFGKKSSMQYNISGLKTTDHKPITMTIDDVAQDPSTGIKIMVHHPMPTYRDGSAVPSSGEGLLSETVELVMHYPTSGEKEYPNLKCGGYAKVDGTTAVASGVSAEVTKAKGSNAVAVFDEGDQVDANGEDFIGEELLKKMATALKTESKNGVDVVNGYEAIDSSYVNLVPESATWNLFINDFDTNFAKDFNDKDEAQKIVIALIIYLAYRTRNSTNFNDASMFKKLTEAIEKTATSVGLASAGGSLWKHVQTVRDIFSSDKSTPTVAERFKNIMSDGGSGIVGGTLTPSTGSHVFRRLTLKMSSAILAAGGSDTGELLVGYPMTGVSTNARTESMTVALRVYLGAVLKRPENVIVIPHVAFEGIIEDKFVDATPGQETSCGGIKVAIDGKEYISYQGAYRTENSNGTWTKHPNNGPLGHLDDPYYAELVQGLQIFKPSPIAIESIHKM